MQALYTATATAIGGRSGSIKSSDGVLDHKLAYPKELGGPGGAATNPEQLFAAGYAACFENALLRVARERKQPIRESSVTAHVAIGRNDKGFFELAVELEISVPDHDHGESMISAQTRFRVCRAEEPVSTFSDHALRSQQLGRRATLPSSMACSRQPSFTAPTAGSPGMLFFGIGLIRIGAGICLTRLLEQSIPLDAGR